MTTDGVRGMVHVSGSDEAGWTWRCVDADGRTVAAGTCAFAAEALNIAREQVSARSDILGRMGSLGS